MKYSEDVHKAKCGDLTDERTQKGAESDLETIDADKDRGQKLSTDFAASFGNMVRHYWKIIYRRTYPTSMTTARTRCACAEPTHRTTKDKWAQISFTTHVRIKI